MAGGPPAYIGQGELAPEYKPSPYEQYGRLPGAYPMQPPRQSVSPPFLLAMIIAPLILYLAVFSVVSYKLHFLFPVLVKGTIVTLLIVFLFQFIKYTLAAKSQMMDAWERHSSMWSATFFLSMAIAVYLGNTQGDSNYYLNMRPYFVDGAAKQYFNIDPGHTLGNAVMDGGFIQFTDGTYVDTSKATGFKDHGLWCVAPIVKGDECPQTGTYDFWAVGKDCCSGEPGDFGNCAQNKDSRWGMLVKDPVATAQFSLAAIQAAATSNITAGQTRFYHWVENPRSEFFRPLLPGLQIFFYNLEGYLMFQATFTALAKLVLDP